MAIDGLALLFDDRQRTGDLPGDVLRLNGDLCSRVNLRLLNRGCACAPPLCLVGQRQGLRISKII
jgi:hypothetical protein